MKEKLKNKNYLRIKVIPNSSNNKIKEIMTDDSGEETIKIKIKAAPEKGKANTELIKFLSKELDIKRSNISIISGKTDRIKLIKISK